MNNTTMRRMKLKQRVVLNYFFTNIRDDMDDLKEVIDLTEKYLKKEAVRFGKRVDKEIEKLPSKEEREYTAGWYADDFVRLDRVYPIIQRRALFITLMCMTEANLLLACRMCQRAFDIQKEFKKKGRERVIVQALSYLQGNLTIRDRQLKTHWQFLQDLWSIRNALVHNDGIPKPAELKNVSQFCAPIPTLELDDHNRIILKEGSVQMALHGVNQFFACLTDEIKRNR